METTVVICLKIRTFVVSATTNELLTGIEIVLWFAWKFVPLWYQQQPYYVYNKYFFRCDLLENSYLCGISNNVWGREHIAILVVICLKIRTFVVSATTERRGRHNAITLWFAWKFVPLWYQQQPWGTSILTSEGCDLLENSYLCGISNN